MAPAIAFKSSQEKKKADAKHAKASEGAGFDVDLPGAEDGKVVTRFPPEPSGYLHIGHAKAAMLNDAIAKKYHGKLILRFDDTNPQKEKEEYVENIMSDLKTIGVQHHVLTHTSDHFDLILGYATRMIKEGIAYVDNTPVEQMRKWRMDGVEAPSRNASVEENLKLWQEMQEGTPEGLKCCLRAKIDMQAKNKTMRDPTIYRCNVGTPHHRTGTKYKVYPTYDLACPIVDSIEGVTHCLRTDEYRDRNEQFYWQVHTRTRSASITLATASDAYFSYLMLLCLSASSGCATHSSCASPSSETTGQHSAHISRHFTRLSFLLLLQP